MATKQVSEFPQVTTSDGEDLLHLKTQFGVDNKLKIKDFLKSQGVEKSFSTVADMTSDTTLQEGMVVSTKEFSVGTGGGAVYDVISGTGTANGYNIIAHDTLSISFVLRIYDTQYIVTQWGADPTQVLDSRPPVQAIVDYIGSGGGDILFPTGLYRLTGTAGDDSHNNGILIPWQGIFTEDPKIRFKGIGNAEIRCYTANTIMFRASRPGVEFHDLTLDGRSLSGVWGIGGVAEDRDQVAEIKSQSYQKINRVHFQECEEGYVLEPSASVSGSDSGAFYPVITNCTFNQCVRDIWFKGCTAAAIAVGGADGALAAANRVTRGNVAFCRLERGNVGIDLEYATETTLIGNNYQFFNSGSDPSSGTGPQGTNQSAIALGTNTENTFIIGGNAEANTWSIDNSATALNNMVYGFSLTGVGNNLGTLQALTSNQLRLTDNIKGANAVTSVTFKNSTFVELIADTAGTGTKDFAIETNGVQRYRTFNGTSTFSDEMVFEDDIEVQGKLGIDDDVLVVTSGSNDITPTTSFVELDCSGATCNLDTINGGRAGDILYIHSRAAPARTPTIRDGVGNIQTAGNLVFSNTNETIQLIFDGTNWLEVSRSLN